VTTIVIIALVAAVTSVFLSLRMRTSDPARLGIGVALIVTAVWLGSRLAGVEVTQPPEQRGIGVHIQGARVSAGRASDDRGIALSMAVRATACDEPVDVELTVAPTAEFWIDNEGRLGDGTTLRIAIPTPAGTSPEEAASDARGWTIDDGLAPFSSGVTAKKVAELDVATEADQAATFLSLTVPTWGRTLNPVLVAFRADWTTRRSYLGSCYVTLPSLTGLQTALSTAQLRGKAVIGADAELPGRKSLIVVTSRSTGLRASYRAKDEVTRGVTSLDLEGHTLDEGATLPAPDANLGGVPAWTCRSTPPEKLTSVFTTAPGDPAEDVYSTLDTSGTVALSDARMAELLDQRTCASYVAIESSAAGIRRDLLLMGVGALFAGGIELTLSGLHRPRRPAVSGSR